MSQSRASELIDLGDRLFRAKDPLNSLHQEIALQFYPERADFFSNHNIGDEFADHLMDSYPVMMRRELGNSISAMLRPRDRPWFKCATGIEELDRDENIARYLEYMTGVLKSDVYDTRAKFIKSTKEGDHDFVTFGQAVLSVEESPNRDHLYFCSHHIRDCAWIENEIKEIDHLHRKDAMSARVMRRKFGDKNLHKSVQMAAEKEPNKEFPIRVIVMPSDEYDYIGGGLAPKKGKKLPFVAIYIDADNGKVLKEGFLADFIYCVPRWHTVSGSPYAYSPATIIALPDARMAQQMARILLESGEKSVDPPMIAVEDAVRDVDIRAGAITWADNAYDERLGEALRPINIQGDMKTGFAMRDDLRQMLTKSFFMDKINLPPAESGDMTATEVQRRFEEYVRNLLPLFEPMEIEYNTRLLDKSFAILANMGKFDFSQMPQELSNRDFQFQFNSPIQSASSRIVVSQFGEVLQLIGAAAQMGMNEVPVKLDVALNDAIRGTSAPASWRKSADEIADEREQKQQAAMLQAAAEQAATAAQVTSQVADASIKVGQAMQPPPPPPMAKPGIPSNITPMKRKVA